MKYAIIVLMVVFVACTYKTEEYYTVDAGDDDDDAGVCEPVLCCYYYPSGDETDVCGLVEGLDEYECEDLARATYEEFPSPDGDVKWASVPLLECWMYEPIWCGI